MVHTDLRSIPNWPTVRARFKAEIIQQFSLQICFNMLGYSSFDIDKVVFERWLNHSNRLEMRLHTMNNQTEIVSERRFSVK